MTATVTMPDGRVLAYEEYGDPDGTPVLSFHGGLSSRLDAAPAHGAAAALGVRIVAPDRPGMGLSTYQPKRTLLDWPADVDALTEALHIDRYAVMGWSCGGAYAAVCAAKRPAHVTSVALLSSAVSLDVFGTTKGLARDDRLLLALVRWVPSLASLLMRLTIESASDRRLYEEIRRTFPPPDRAALEERGSPHDAVAFVKESMRNGTKGCLQDYRIFGAPWGFALEEIDVPVHIWEGTEDHTGPPEYNEFLLARIPNARLTRVPGEGHVSLLGHQAESILATLLHPDTLG